MSIPVGTIDWEVWQDAIMRDPELIAARGYRVDLSSLRAQLALTVEERLSSNDETLLAIAKLQQILRLGSD